MGLLEHFISDNRTELGISTSPTHLQILFFLFQSKHFWFIQKVRGMLNWIKAGQVPSPVLKSVPNLKRLTRKAWHLSGNAAQDTIPDLHQDGPFIPTWSEPNKKILQLLIPIFLMTKSNGKPNNSKPRKEITRPKSTDFWKLLPG